MNKKIIFLDIDGTLTAPGTFTPPESAMEAIHKAQAAGHKVFLCTGRTPLLVRPFENMGFDGIIGASGGFIRCGDEIIFDRRLTLEQQKRIFEVFDRCGMHYIVEGTVHNYADDGFRDFVLERIHEDANSEALAWRRRLERLGTLPISSAGSEQFYKMVFMVESTAQLQGPLAELGKEFNLQIQDSGPGIGYANGELIPFDYDKGQGVLRVCRYLGVDPADTYGFGDSMNDVEMIKTVGVGCCMANGSPTLKKLADRICPPVEEDGLYKAFEEFRLFEKA